MEILIEAVGQEKQSKFGAYFGVKVNGEWLNVSGNRDESLKGRRFEAEIKPSGKFKWAKLVKEIGSGNSSGRGGGGSGIPWESYAAMARLAHELALEMEPDETGSESHFEDRSQARAAIMNTVMIAFSNGKIALPDDEGIPPDADMPF